MDLVETEDKLVTRIEIQSGEKPRTIEGHAEERSGEQGSEDCDLVASGAGSKD